jgi:beta-glucanase (GH16 family)
VTSHPLGRGAFLPANVGFGPAGLTLRMPQGTLNGGELQGRQARGAGTSTARMRTSSSPGSISAFFLYRQDLATDSSDELDFEIPGGPPHRAILTVWQRGRHVPTAQRTVSLDFDPSAAEHEYRFVRDGAKVTFVIDGRTRFAYAHAPSVALPPVFNAWYPTWQDPTQPPAGGVMRVSRYTFTG